ncbi:MAG: polysaccharide pyruvyl transferase family protein [Prevotella sp.]|nr:polysaccharide pyruvyl transferase family protein [Prevotella sp.]
MKIGILTYHRSHNYGALLQAIALRSALKQMGNEVYYVDYVPDIHRQLYLPYSKAMASTLNLKGKATYLLGYFWRERRHAKFAQFIAQHIAPYCRGQQEEYDVIVYGSDQIWRKQPDTGTFDPMYFGAGGLLAGRHVSYAASMGMMSLDEEDRQRLKELVSHLKYIGVREEPLKSLLESLGVCNVRLTLDPTLLLNSGLWDKILPPKPDVGKGYLLFYDLLAGSFANRAVRAFARSRGLNVIRIEGDSSRIALRGRREADEPTEFVNLIRHASYVLTSSFHGLAFSLIFHRPFFAAFRENKGRAEALLSLCGLSDRMVDAGAESIPSMPEIDFANVDEKIRQSREASFDYLSNSLYS